MARNMDEQPDLLEDLLIPVNPGYLLTIPARYAPTGERYQRHYGEERYEEALQDAKRFDSPELRRMLWRRRHWGHAWGDQKAPVAHSPASDNRTGMTGIQFSLANRALRRGDMWTASGRDADGRQQLRRFSVARHGFDTALLRAVRQRLEWRELTSDASRIPAEHWAAVVRAWHVRFFGEPFDLDRLLSERSKVAPLGNGSFSAMHDSEEVARTQYLPGEPLYETRLRAALPLLELNGVSFELDVEGVGAPQVPPLATDLGPEL